MPSDQFAVRQTEQLKQALHAGAGSRGRTMLRRVTPISLVATGIGTFVGIAVGARVLTLLVPDGVDGLLALMVVAVLVGSAMLLAAGQWLPERWLYPFFRLVAIIAVLIYVPLFVLGTNATALLLIAAIGLPNMCSHFLKQRDLLILMVVWTAVLIGSFAALVANGHPTPFTPLLITVIPTAWLLAWLSREQTIARFRALGSARLQGLTDSLTGLTNRRGLLAAGEALIADDALEALLLIDLDDFKRSNTVYGHPGGDHVLQVVGRRLGEATGSHDLAARLGGDEFVVLVNNAHGADIAALEDRFENVIASSDALTGLPGVSVSASVGGAISSGPDESIESLLARAEQRLAARKAERAAARTDDPRGLATGAVRPMPADVSRVHPPPTGLPLRHSIVLEPSFGAIVASLSVLVAVPFLGKDASPLIVAGIALLVLLIALTARLSRQSFSPGAASSMDYGVYALVGVIAWLGGGTNGPALPLLLLLITYSTWHSGRLEMAGKFVLAQLVAFSTLLYQEPSTLVGREAQYGTIAAFSLMFTIVTVLTVHNHMLMERVRASARRQSERDKLTGVFNRRAFERLTAAAIARGVPFAVVMIDLDNFKAVNTEEGYDGGDRVLSAIGPRLDGATRAEDHVGRVGGDEFAALLADAGDIDVEQAAQRFMDAVDAATAEQSSAAAKNVSASCGIAIYPEHGDDFESLMRSADLALMAVKADGKRAARIHRPARAAFGS